MSSPSRPSRPSRPSPSAIAAYPHPSAWTGAEVAVRDDWIVRLGPAQNRELRDALAVATSRGADIPSLAAADFPLPTLAPQLRDLARGVVDGRGFVLIRGLQIDDLPIRDAARIYWGIGSHMGHGRAQNAQGDMLGHVTDLGLDFRTDPNARGYQTRLRLPFHNDAMDIVGLLCWMPAKSGGLSRIVSSTAIYNTIAERRPDLMDVVTAPMCIDRRGETPAGKTPWYEGALFERVGERLFCRYNRTYIESAQRFAEVPRLSARQVEAMDLIDALCDDPALYLDMALQRGDMQFISNYTVLHSRTDFEDWPERERRRYLLRLWLDTGRVAELPASFADRYDDTLAWQRDPKPPVFDLSMRHAELAH
jgi:Taurine catabolism dioxygenase TauD, TfdA family